MSYMRKACLAAVLIAAFVAAPGLSAEQSGPVDAEQARQIALEQSKGGVVVESEVDYKRHGRVFYEFEIVNDGVWYEIEIDGSDGSLIELKQKRGKWGAPHHEALQPRLDITEAEAIALERTGGGEVVEYELDDEHFGLVHEIVVIKDNVRHRMEIDDTDGRILKYKGK